MPEIPSEVIRIAAEATSPHNDGFARKVAIRQLITLRNYIDGILRVVPQGLRPEVDEINKLEEEG